MNYCCNQLNTSDAMDDININALRARAQTVSYVATNAEFGHGASQQDWQQELQH